MYTIIKIFFMFALICVVHGQQGSCEIALNGGPGQCKSIFKCQALLSIVNKAEKTTQEKRLLKRSHCGIDDDAPAVCCPVQKDPRQCLTPEGKPGQCISLYSCPNVMKLLTPPASPEKLQFVQNSKCKGADQYSVCCGPIPNFNNAANGECSLSAFPPDPRSECCGADITYYNKIYAGNKSTIELYPWLTMIEYVKDGNLKTHGSGALISGLYVVTVAAAVFTEILGKPINIRLGEYDTSHEGPDCKKIEYGGETCTDGAIRIRIEKTIIHPQYDAEKKINDIALIRLSRMAPYTDFIRPICLPTSDVTLRTDDFYLTIAGWDAINLSEGKSDTKNHVEVPYVSREKCQLAYVNLGHKTSLGKGHLCAGGVEGKDSCRDSSTLMYKNDKIYEFTGIVSYGTVPCGLKGIPSVYTNVFVYNSWIMNTIVP